MIHTYHILHKCIMTGGIYHNVSVVSSHCPAERFTAECRNLKRIVFVYSLLFCVKVKSKVNYQPSIIKQRNKIMQ